MFGLMLQLGYSPEEAASYDAFKKVIAQASFMNMLKDFDVEVFDLITFNAIQELFKDDEFTAENVK